MSNAILCPMKFSDAANPRLVSNPGVIDWTCEREKCAWWSKGGERCVLVTLSMGLWALSDNMKDSKANNMPTP